MEKYIVSIRITGDCGNKLITIPKIEFYLSKHFLLFSDKSNS